MDHIGRVEYQPQPFVVRADAKWNSFAEFVKEPAGRQRYWARATVGWPKMASARPNPAHLALAELEQSGWVPGLITQNVDRLHHRAGSHSVVELHGALEEVTCLDCGEPEHREALQQRLLALNPGFEGLETPIAPDGDADLASERIRGFVVPACLRCGGTLKPNVVYFGEAVPAERLERAWSLFDRAQALLVVGSSLTVFSGYRFVKEAARRGMPIGVVNLGPTRGDPLADVRVDADVTSALPELVSRLGTVAPRRARSH